MDIYVGNLPYSAEPSELESTFGQYGEVTNVHIVNDRETGRSKGFGFVTMPNDEEAEAAIAALEGASFEGRPLKVNAARPREERSGGGGGGRSGGGFSRAPRMGGGGGGRSGGDRRSPRGGGDRKSY